MRRRVTRSRLQLGLLGPGLARTSAGPPRDHAAAARIPARFAATKLIEGDAPTLEAIRLNDNELDTLEHITAEMETALGTDREAALAELNAKPVDEAAELEAKYGSAAPAAVDDELARMKAELGL